MASDNSNDKFYKEKILNWEREHNIKKRQKEAERRKEDDWSRKWKVKECTELFKNKHKNKIYSKS